MATILIFSVIILVTIFVPVLAATWLRRRYETPWMVFVVGALAFGVSQAIHIPLNNLLLALKVLPRDVNYAALWQTALIMGLTAGVSEALARAGSYALLKRRRSGADGVMLGLGHGGIEMMFLGGALVAAGFSSFHSTPFEKMLEMVKSPEQMQALELQAKVFGQLTWVSFLPLVERLMALSLHVSLSLMMLQAFRQKNILFGVLTVFYHALTDAAAVFLAYNVDSLLLKELPVAIMALPAVVLTLKFWGPRKSEQTHRTSKFTRELALFAIAFRKEVTELWRTRRFLVTIAVFVLFGVMSPLLAKFMPEMIKNMEEAKMFADLIPEPSATDAVTQYLKNLSQFGFITVILLSMGGVVGEKERGVAAVILSKPLPRWVFIGSKFAAQVLMLACGFIISTLGAWYYTAVLFEPVDVGTFALINVLMLIWLSVFATVTLLGSVIAKSNGAAAGIGLGASTLILLLGNIPGWGGLMPSGVMAWANQLGTLSNETVPANGGAVAMSLVLVIMLVIGSVAVFEQQEL